MAMAIKNAVFLDVTSCGLRTDVSVGNISSVMRVKIISDASVASYCQRSS
jgi:hypothetical protein